MYRRLGRGRRVPLDSTETTVTLRGRLTAELDQIVQILGSRKYAALSE